MPSAYQRKEWKEFRRDVIESDGCKFTRCGRKEGQVVLQVHHKRYIPGRKVWEYGLQDCITLCKGCHAAEHGIIRPRCGWQYIGDDDLGDLCGTCENCGTSIRYVFIIYHRNWGTMEVGTLCCDNLTDFIIATNQSESRRRYKSRRKRFLNSKRWKSEEAILKIRQCRFDIEIEENDTGFYLTIHKQKSKRPYLELEEAKARAFEVIESGELIDYLKRKEIVFRRL